MNNTVPFHFGSEVYTWFMHQGGKTYTNKLGPIMEVIADAGFTGVQPIHFWMGNLSDPGLLAAKLNSTGLKLAALSLALPWLGDTETEQERKEADQVISLLRRFTGAMLCTVQIPSDRRELSTRRQHLVKVINSISRRAAEQGVPCSFHPNSPHTSISRTQEDYDSILPALDHSATGWTPDVGHLINGGMDPLSKMKEYASLINHVHFKDWHGEPEFALMGSGKVDFVSITQWLKDQHYSGWIICEDEGIEALADPDAVTRHDGRWIRETLLKAIQ